MEENQDQDQQDQDQAFTQEQQEIMGKMLDDRDQKWKKEIDSLNRRNNALDKIIKEKDDLLEKIKTEKMTEEERLKLELDRRDQELTARERELVIKANREKATKYAAENDIPLDLLELVPMTDETRMMESLDKVKGVVDADRTSVMEGRKKSGGDKPKAGGAPIKKGGKRKSEMSIGEATRFAREHGKEAYDALPE